MQPLHLVWFKRDLRIRDHRPLVEAAMSGRVVPLFVFEPSLWNSPEYDASHFDFICGSLRELSRQLQERGGRLAVHVGELPEVFESLSKSHTIASLYSHEETGTWLTYERDKRIARWCRSRGIVWNEYPQNGVVRRLQNRNGWSSQWARRMAQNEHPIPERVEVPDEWEWGSIPSVDQVITNPSRSPAELPAAGEHAAYQVLDSFLTYRGTEYQSAMSSPLTAETSCSRLSPYLAWGNLSMKQVKHAVDRRLQQLGSEDNGRTEEVKQFKRSLRSFTSRLSWHCHFMQKLESEPELEFHNICRAYDGLRENEFSSTKFEAWKEGLTGFPMVDACMRYLRHHRWINFRMRAMLMSFAAYHLWLHWREPATFLARNFLDFEPGIHYPQCQMQSGVTGINTLRIYSPAKQLLDQDPEGTFVRRWVPELEHVPLPWLAKPHQMSLDDQSRYRCRIGIDYPSPIVDDLVAVRYAKDRLYAVRRTEDAKLAAEQVYLKHGSRKQHERDPLPGQSRNSPRKKSSPSGTQRAKKVGNQPTLPGFDDATDRNPSIVEGSNGGS